MVFCTITSYPDSRPGIYKCPKQLSCLLLVTTCVNDTTFFRMLTTLELCEEFQKYIAALGISNYTMMPIEAKNTNIRDTWIIWQ